MKTRTKSNGSKNDDWATPQYIYDYMEKEFFKGGFYFDPCPLKADFNGLKMGWGALNYINHPYNQKGKEAFIRKAYCESNNYANKKLCVMLIPANTETKVFHEVIAPNAEVFLIKGRVKFKGYNVKGEYVTNKTGQSGHMFVVFGRNLPKIKTIEIVHEVKK